MPLPIQHCSECNQYKVVTPTMAPCCRTPALQALTHLPERVNLLVNLTPHPLTLFHDDGTHAVVLTSGLIARCREATETEYDLSITLNFSVLALWHQDTVGLPEPQPGVWFVTTYEVAARNPHRSDLLTPSDAVRDMHGTIVGYRRLEQWLFPWIPQQNTAGA